MKALFVLAALAAGSCWADDHSLSLGLGGGYALPVGGKKFNSVAGGSAMGSLWIRHKGLWPVEIEGGADYLDFSGIRSQAQYAGIGVLFRPWKDSEWNPSLLASFGYAHARSDDRFGFKVRAGAERVLNRVITAGAYVNYHVFPGTTSGPVIHVLSPMLAVMFRLGDCGCEKGTAVKVTKTETKRLVEPAEEFEEPESDDEVSDMDADGDGVSNTQDQCPGTPSDMKVNDLGCPKEKKTEIQLNVEFEPYSAEISDKYEAEIIRVAKLLTDHPSIKGTVEGHTDNLGNELANQKLSQERADSVRAALVKAGVSSARLKARGFGGENPIAENKTDEGRKKNRRVILAVD